LSTTLAHRLERERDGYSQVPREEKEQLHQTGPETTITDATAAAAALTVSSVCCTSTRSISSTMTFWRAMVGPRDKRHLFLLKGIFGFLSLSSVFYTITHLPLGDAVTLSFTSPIFTTILARLILGEPVYMRDAVASLLSLVGVIMIARPAFLFGTDRLSETSNNHSDSQVAATSRSFAVVVALGGALCAAGSFVTIRKIGDKVNTFVLVQYHSLVSIFAAPIFSVLLEDPVMPTGWFWGKLLLVGLLAFGGQTMLSRSLQLERASLVVSVKYSQIVFAFIWQSLLLHESSNVWSICGAILITCTTVVKATRGNSCC
jgi:drug/metabolite transporter (DMT)-like permease